MRNTLVGLREIAGLETSRRIREGAVDHLSEFTSAMAVQGRGRAVPCKDEIGPRQCADRREPDIWRNPEARSDLLPQQWCRHGILLQETRKTLRGWRSRQLQASQRSRQSTRIERHRLGGVEQGAARTLPQPHLMPAAY